MDGFPEATPVTIPDEEPTVADNVLLLAQAPPAGLENKVEEAPAQTARPPVIDDGIVFTVTVAILLQPVEVSVKVTGAVPADIPVTTPLVTLTVAIPVAPHDHVPVPEPLVNVIVFPWQTGVLPDDAANAPGTDTVVVTTVPHKAV